MKKKFLGRVLTMLLVASMVFTLLPAPAIAAGNWWWNNDEYTEEAVPTATADENYHYNIFFLDCGRKYYSVDSIKALIDNASAAGFNYIQLAVGNDGLRLLLDDMSLEVNGTTYDSEAVKAAIHAGNEAYYNFSTDELTQSEMDTIIDYAAKKGMGVIPCVNTPGHMDAILSAATSLTGTNCSYSGSARTIDVTNETATAFTKALLQKYITYFKSQGCQLFNMGADEYANDRYTGGSMGFGNLQDTGKYHYYVTYVNAVAAMIKDAGMTPMAFNDGIYFNSNTSSGTFDTDIIICYWSNGWSSYRPMPAAELASKGFKLVNTHGDYYWVLGKTDAQCSASKASGFNYKSFQGSTIDAPAGSMFCIWADYPGAETEADVVSKTADTIKAFGGALPVLTPSQPDTGITITPSKPSTGGASNTVTMGEQMTLTANEKVYWSWNSEVVELTSADSDEAASTVALYAEQSLYAQSVNVKPLKAGDAGITVAADETGTPQPYSLTVVNSAAPAGVTVDLKVDEDKTVKVDGANYAGEYSTENPAVATVTVTGQNAVPDKTNYPVANPTYYQILGDDSSSWVKTEYFYSNDNGSNYYPVYAKRTSSGILWWATYTYTLGYLVTGGSSNVNVIASLKTDSISNRPTEIILYGQPSVVSGTPASTDITFTGKAEGTTYVTIGGTRYTIKVSYYEQPVNVVLDRSKQVTVSGRLNDDGLNTDVATVSVDGTTMTVTGVAEGNTSVIVGNTKYHITVSTEDLEAVPPLKIEYWITNGRVVETGTATTEKEIAATSVNSEKGLAITELVPHEGRKQDDDNANMLFWKATRLTKGNEQTNKDGVDQTMKGDDFSFIHYWNSQWEFSADGTSWTAFNDDDQVVAYYMQVTKVTNEVTTTVVDWGVPPSQLTWNKKDFALLDFSVKYESGERLPNTFANEKTVAYALDRTVTERHIGRINAIETAEYEVYMITVTPNNDNKNVSVADAVDKVTSGGYTYDGTEKVIWVDKEENLGDFADTTLHATGFRVGGEASIVDGITMNKKQGVLVTYYLRTKVTEDSLTVNYVNKTTGEQFYSYNIAVASGTAFKPTIRLDNPAERNLLDGDVINIKGVIQNVTADLIKMPGVPAQYRYSKYQCKELVRNNDKTITLYYTFNNSVGFVVDFGLPLTIAPKDVNEKLALSGVTIDSVKVENVTYGTCSIDGTNFTFTYTPGKDFVSSGSGEALTVKYTGQIFNEETHQIQQSTVAYQVYIYPASNVLYEASFLTQGTETTNNWVTRYGWNATPFGDEVQQTQKLDTPQIFGLDPAYQSVTTEKGFWKASGLKAAADGTKSLTTSFYGNAIDVIGSCGPNTGRVMVTIKDAATGNPVKSVLVETTYSAGDIAQVPLAHIELDAEKSYTAVIYGYAPRASAAKQQSARAPMLAASYYSDDSYDALTADLAAMGLNLSDVEVISAADAAAKTASVRRAPQAYALNTVDEGTTDGATVTIDGFRVYRSTNNTNYPTSEQNVTYRNVLDVVGNTITAYTENGDKIDIAVKDYEAAGGPQNEVYLRNGQSVVFQITGVGKIQVSLRAVGASAKWNGKDITSNTEMYYELTANNGVFTIANSSENLLAIGNVKIPANAQEIKTVRELPEEAVARSIRMALNAAPETPDTVFEPTISAKVTTTKFIRSKVVTLTVSASADVAKLTVNGKELRPTNGWLVSMGWSKSYNYILTETVKKSETKTYEIIGYSADGTPSTPTVVKSK